MRQEEIKIPEKIPIVPIPLSQIISEMHPHLNDTPISLWTEDIIKSLRPYLLFENEPEEKKKDQDKTFDCVMRGSLMKRYLLGTPKGYLNIPEVFRTLGLDETSENLTKNVIKKLSLDPVEIDVRMEWKKGTKNKIVPAIGGSLLKNGFILKSEGDTISFINGDIKAVIKPYEIGTKKHHRTLYNIIFTCGSKQIFNIDLTDLPNENKFLDEMRLSYTSGGFELFSTMELTIDDEVNVLMDPYLKEYRTDRNPYLHYEPKTFFPRKFGHLLREVGGGILWPPHINDAIEYDLNYMLRSYDRLAEPYSNVPLTLDEIEILTQRNESFISDLLMYTTYDPFLFLLLGQKSNLLSHLPIGNLLKKYEVDEGGLFEICGYMADELDSSSDAFMMGISEFSHMYKEAVLKNTDRDVNLIGPFLLMRAINKYASVHSAIEPISEDMDTFINLINPLLISS